MFDQSSERASDAVDACLNASEGSLNASIRLRTLQDDVGGVERLRR